MHIVDISHQGFEEQIEVVNRTLKEINARRQTNNNMFLTKLMHLLTLKNIRTI